MKKRLLPGFLVAALAVSMAACSDDQDPAFEANGSKGRINVSVDLNTRVQTSAGSRSGKEYGDVTDADLTLRLVSEDGSYDKSWPIAEFPSDGQYKVGRYTIEAFYGSADDEGFESPHYYGSQTITVRENEVTSARISASLANAMVSVDYTEAFKKYFTSWSSEIVSPAANTISLLADETRPVYIKPGTTHLFVNVTKPSGATARLQPADIVTEARHHYHVTFDVNNGGVSDAQLVITFDDMLAQEEVVVDLSDELMNSPAPVITPRGFTSGEPLHVVEGIPFEGDLSMLVMARGTLSQLPMVTVSPDLTALGWPADLDLGAASAGQQSLLQQLGFASHGVFDPVKSQMAQIDFSKVVANLKYVEGRTNENRFTFYAKDRMTKVSEPVELVVIVDKMELNLTDGFVLTGANTMSALLEYPGPNIEQNVKVQIFNERGTWTDCQYTATPVARAGNTYKLTITVPANQAQYRMRAIFRNNEASASEALLVTPAERELSVAAPVNSVWAKTADLVFTSATSEYTDAQLAASCTVMIAADGEDYRAASLSRGSGNTVTLTGLTPGKRYTAYAYIGANSGRASLPVTFSTEAATQLPNAGMEDWIKGAGESHWETMYPWTATTGSPWGTNNPMTTSQGGNYGYTRISGTISTQLNNSEDFVNKLSADQCAAHTGSNAAIIQTVGWGSGNSATGSKGSSGKTKYIDAGLLHLGADRTARPSGYGDVSGTISTTDLNCGLAFASRPQSMSFWYKYFPRNGSDKGYAEVTVYNEAGAVLATAKVNLDAASTYTQKTLTLSYPAGCAKAAKIYVKFLSTNSESFLTKSDANLAGPGFANLNRGTFMGSQLVIDDIALNY